MDESKEFQRELYQHIGRIIDSLEGTARIFWKIDSDMGKSEITIRFGSTLSYGDLPQPVQKMIQESEAKLRAKEDGDGSNVITKVLEGTITKPPEKTLQERIKQIEDEHSKDVKA